MKINDKIEFSITVEYGTAISCSDRELADELDDYLTENFDPDILYDFQDDLTILYVLEFKDSKDVEKKLRAFLENR